MHNNTHRNQQLKRDRLFLERIFLLDIEQRETSSNKGNIENISAHFHKSSTAPISLVSIYAIVVTLLLLLPSNHEKVNSKTVLKDTASHIVVKPKK